MAGLFDLFSSKPSGETLGYTDWADLYGSTADKNGYNDYLNATKGGGSIFGNQGFGMNQGTLQGLGTLGQLGGGLASMFLGNKQLKLAQDQFNFNKDMATKQYEMAKDAYEKNKKRAESIGSQMQAGAAKGV